MSNLSPVGYWTQDPYVKMCLAWRSITTRADFSGAYEEYADYCDCTDQNNPYEMRDRLWTMETTFYKDSKGVVRRMVTPS